MLKMLTLRYNTKMEKQQTEAVPQVFVRPGSEVFFTNTHCTYCCRLKEFVSWDTPLNHECVCL